MQAAYPVVRVVANETPRMPSVDSQMATQRLNSGQSHCAGAIKVRITKEYEAYRLIITHADRDRLSGILGITTLIVAAGSYGSVSSSVGI